MKRHALQGVLGLLVLASSVAGCSGGEPQEETWSLELTCATDLSANPAWTTFLARIRSSRGAAPSAPVDVAIESPVVKHNFSVPSGSGVAVVDLEGQELTIGVFTATGTAQVSGQSLSASCTSVAGLSAFAASAQGTSTGATAIWTSVPEAMSYEVQALDPTGTATALATARTTATRADLAFARDPINPPAVLVTARAFDPDALPSVLSAPRSSHTWTAVTSGKTGGDGSAWQLFGPGDYEGETLTVSFHSLGVGERLAVLLVNADGRADAPASVLISGTQPTARASSQQREIGSSAAALFGDDSPGMRDRLARAAALWRREPSSPAATAVYPTEGLTGSFCGSVATSSTWEARRFPSTVRALTSHAVFWVADESQAEFNELVAKRPDFWSKLGTAFETEVAPLLAERYGPFSDVDGDGRVAVLFRNLGVPQPGQVLTAMFEGYGTQDTTADCSTGGLNHADIVHVAPPSGWYRVDPGLTADDLVDLEYPAVVAHELTHDIDYTAHLGLPTSGLADGWVAEGLATSAAETIRFARSTRTVVGDYLDHHRTTSLTGFGNTMSDYGKVALLFHFLRERAGPAFLRQLIEDPAPGRVRFVHATGLTPELALAQLATTSLFSNEPSCPSERFDLTDSRWAPLHAKVGAASVALLPPGVSTTRNLGNDAWDALVSGKGTDGQVTLTVTSTEARKPNVVVVRFTGDLPD